MGVDVAGILPHHPLELGDGLLTLAGLHEKHSEPVTGCAVARIQLQCLTEKGERPGTSPSLHQVRRVANPRVRHLGRGLQCAFEVLHCLAMPPLPSGLLGLLEQAQQAARQGRHRQAVEYFERALQAAPEMANPRIRYSAYLMQRGRGPRALALLSEALQLDPGDSAARYRLAVLLVQSGEGEQAVSQLERVVGEDPRNVNAHLLLAEQYDRLERGDDAVRQLESLLAVDPNSAAAARRLIRHHFHGGSCDRAAGRAEEAVTLHRDDPSFGYWKAWIDLWCERAPIDEVRELLESQARVSRSLDSGMVDGLWAQVYAHVLVREGRRAEAVRLQSQVVDVITELRESAERSAASRRLSDYRRGALGPRSLPVVGLERYVPAPPRLAEGG